MASRSIAPSVLITVEPPGIAWPHVDTLARELAALEVEVTVAAVAPLRPGQRVDYAALPGVELLSCPVPAATAIEHLANRARIAEWLLGIEESLNPDVVHLTGYLHAGLPWCGRVMVAGHPGGASAYGRLEAEHRRLCRAAFHYGLKGADMVITPTEAMLNALTRHFGTLPGRVIRDGRDPNRYAPAIKEPVVLSAGPQRDDPTRPSGLEAVAHAISWPVVIAGEQADVDGSPIRLEGVSSLGRLHPSHMVPWFNRASIFVALAAEGSGAFLPEAALAGCALVLGDTPALREAWSGAALFVSSEDRESLTAGLRTLTGDRRLREAMGHAARRRALKNPARAMAEAYLSAYRDLIAARAPNQFAAEKSG